jgi:hypothetical protein
MIEGVVGGIASAILLVLFAHVYRKDRQITYAFYLAVIFAGVTFNYAMNVLARITVQGDCLNLPYYGVRTIGTGVACVCIIYGGWKLLALAATPARKEETVDGLDDQENRK